MEKSAKLDRVPFSIAFGVATVTPASLLPPPPPSSLVPFFRSFPVPLSLLLPVPPLLFSGSLFLFFVPGERHFSI
jgi:hypothetical protein